MQTLLGWYVCGQGTYAQQTLIVYRKQPNPSDFRNKHVAQKPGHCAAPEAICEHTVSNLLLQLECFTNVCSVLYLFSL